MGEVLSNTEYAQTLRLIARNGAGYFYQGKMAEDIVAKVRDVTDNRGLLSVEDMAAYKASWNVRPFAGDTRGYKVCSMGQPSSGGLTLLDDAGHAGEF